MFSGLKLRLHVFAKSVLIEAASKFEVQENLI